MECCQDFDFCPAYRGLWRVEGIYHSARGLAAQGKLDVCGTDQEDDTR